MGARFYDISQSQPFYQSDEWQLSLTILRAHAQATPDLTLYIDAGSYNLNGRYYEWDGGDSPAFTPPTTPNMVRIDVLYVDATGFHIVTGTEVLLGAIPSVPVVPDNVGRLRYVQLYYGQTAITNDDLVYDPREFLSIPSGLLETWSYADAAARTGATGFVANDVGRIAYQQDTETYWRLDSITPTWTQIAGTGILPGAHVLATTTALGAQHTVSGLTARQVLIATAANNAEFRALEAADIPALAYAPSAHNILSASHGDTTAAAAVRGDIITAQGASPVWARLAHPGAAYRFLTTTASDVAWSTYPLALDGDVRFTDGADRTISVADQTAVDTAGNNLSLVAANGSGAGDGGTISLTGGIEGYGDWHGASFTLEGGHDSGSGGAATFLAGGFGAGTGGQVYLYGQDPSSGGDVQFIGGNAIASSNSSGGNVLFLPGVGDGTGSNGYLGLMDPVTGIRAFFDPGSLTSTDKTFAFPNISGTFALGAGTLTSTSTDDVTVAAHTHAITGSLGLLGNASARYHVPVSGATPFAYAESGFMLDGTTGGKTVFSVTNAKTLTLTAADTYTLTIANTASVSGTNTGDQTITLTGAVTGSGTGSFATTIATPGTCTVSSTNSTATAHTHAITSSSDVSAGTSALLASNAGNLSVKQFAIGEAVVSNHALRIAGTITSIDNTFGVYMGALVMKPATGNNAYFQYVGGGKVDTDVANTIPIAVSLYAEKIQKLGTGTITNTYSIYALKSTTGTNNFGAYIEGEIGVGTIPIAGRTIQASGYSHFGDLRLNGTDAANTIWNANANNLAITANGGDVSLGQTSTQQLLVKASGSVLIGTLTDGMTANGSLAIAQDLGHRGSKLGFYNTTPIAKQTGVAVTAAGIHAACVALGLFSA